MKQLCMYEKRMQKIVESASQLEQVIKQRHERHCDAEDKTLEMYDKETTFIYRTAIDQANGVCWGQMKMIASTVSSDAERT